MTAGSPLISGPLMQCSSGRCFFKVPTCLTAMQNAGSETRAAQEQPRSVFELIHSLHEAIKASIDASLSWEDLNSPPVNYTVVRPLVKRFSPTRTQSHESGGAEASSSSSARRHSGASTGHKRSVTDRFLRPRDGGEGGRAGGPRHEEEGVTLGAILYALMANRYVFHWLRRENRIDASIGYSSSHLHQAISATHRCKALEQPSASSWLVSQGGLSVYKS